MIDENAEYSFQQKAELNSPNCPWKFLGKQIFEYMNEERRKNDELPFEIKMEECQFNSEENNEFAIFDCGSRARKRELTIKKLRKTFVGETLTFKMMIRNPLMVDLLLSNIKIICRYEG